jgi:hypothetical protein
MAARALVAALVVSGCSRVPKPAPIAIGPQHELLVPVVINGQRLTLQLDTGASMTAITHAVRQRLHVYDAHPTKGAGAAGPLENVEIVMLQSTEIADHLVHRLPAAVVDIENADGVLGMDVLGEYITEIDLGQHLLLLHRRGDDTWRTPDLMALRYEALDGGQIRVDVVVEGRPVTAIIDVGSNWSFANQRAAPDREEAASLMTAAVGVDHHLATFAAMRDVAVVVGDQKVVASALLISDLPIFRSLGIADRPAMILGADALAERRLVIVPHEHRLYVSRAKN